LTDSPVVRDPEGHGLRIHFTDEDLERIQVRPTLGPLGETVKAMSLLRCPRQPRMPYRQWRGQVKGGLTPQMAAFTALIPPGSKGVDLSMLTGTAATLEQGVLALLAVPREHLLAEMEFTDREHRRGHAEGDRAGGPPEQAAAGRGRRGEHRQPSAQRTDGRHRA
jgi:hypothetical protein